MQATDYDIGIVGGGLAGLTAAIRLRKQGYRVVLFEKKTYPFHRVCGEYISRESWDYLGGCGIDLPALQVPFIKKLEVSAPNGALLKADLDPGGFGISRYLLDNLLFEQARALGISVLDGTTADHLRYAGDCYHITTSRGDCTVKLALGSFGKRSNLDIQWKRHFVSRSGSSLNNYIGVKYHIKTDFAHDTIALHNFRDGYCGLSRVEENKYCLCYLTTAANLREAGDIPALEKNVLCLNPYLRAIFDRSEFLSASPVTISQVSFAAKEAVYNKVPLAGDACGMITPLCGNGMSMAMHSGKIFSGYAAAYLQRRIGLPQMLWRYQAEWRASFSRRMFIGRMIQSSFGKSWQTNLLIGFLKKNPRITNAIIARTHGQPF